MEARNLQKKVDLTRAGASLKDLGKKCFGFEIMDSSWIAEIMRNL